METTVKHTDTHCKEISLSTNTGEGNVKTITNIPIPPCAFRPLRSPLEGKKKEVFSLKKNCFVKQEGLLPHGGFQGHWAELIH